MLRPVLLFLWSLNPWRTIRRLREDLEFLREAAKLSLGSIRAREAELRELRAQLVAVRVCQSKIGRAGWEVMCFIPEEVLAKMRVGLHGPLNEMVRQITSRLVFLAVQGIHRVDSQGRVCALVFEPLNTARPVAAPSYVQALFEKDGTFKMSEKCWDQRTEEQRLMA